MVGIIIVAHCCLAGEFLRSLKGIVGDTDGFEAVNMDNLSDGEAVRRSIEAAIKKVDKGSGVLIFTDMFGGTPSNLSLSFLQDDKVEVISGVNLPMLLKVYTMRGDSNLKKLAQEIKEYGKKHILIASEFLRKDNS